MPTPSPLALESKLAGGFVRDTSAAGLAAEAAAAHRRRLGESWESEESLAGRHAAYLHIPGTAQLEGATTSQSSSAVELPAAAATATGGSVAAATSATSDTTGSEATGESDALLKEHLAAMTAASAAAEAAEAAAAAVAITAAAAGGATGTAGARSGRGLLGAAMGAAPASEAAEPGQPPPGSELRQDLEPAPGLGLGLDPTDGLDGGLLYSDLDLDAVERQMASRSRLLAAALAVATAGGVLYSLSRSHDARRADAHSLKF